jgi:hypothetical protein
VRLDHLLSKESHWRVKSGWAIRGDPEPRAEEHPLTPTSITGYSVCHDGGASMCFSRVRYPSRDSAVITIPF